ncbi:C40 family peptidase [Oryzihumus sp.]|uniref:C40 family peptidase n=1 Tax=Oryzihumus sp. TaxID=1968903 RepID=UPI002ED7D238
MSKHHAGRHRGAGRQTTTTALTSVLGRSGQPAAKASAVLAVSGGLVASFSMPASAAPATHAPEAATPTNAPGTVAVSAPTTAATPVAPSFGEVGFDATAPKAAAPVQRAVETVSRSTDRMAINLPSPAAGVLGIAAMYAGVPYEWGGTTPAGFDCSGFTQYVFSKIGISLPRTAEEQRMAATRVSNPQPGDLVFFGNPAHHVGIYAGGGMMWDAPHSGSVVSKRPIWNDSSITYGRFS